MIISTFNIKNDFNYYNKNKSLEIFNYLRNNKIDVLGLQEVFYKCDKDLCKLIKNSYNMVGKYRFLFKLFHPTDNEKTPIITNKNIIESNTYRLPFYPSNLKRVMSHIVILENDKEVSIYNTHIESRLPKVKEKQLDKIYEIISNDKRPKILMGDFNLKDTDIMFENFVNKLKELDIKEVEINERTFKTEKEDKAIDHIFISDNYKIVNTFVIKDLIISDHYPVIVEIREN